ncbi:MULTISPECIES: GAF domain-containing sensor histidine kinase [Pseudomonas]|uniref:histidine kinase n=1 Tax=Pseudomonas orientalis TaxID=76758 RepID=A0A4Q7CYE9_9PSED|nr:MULTISPECIES: GAF domain-containing sensor histidine kinase [Pseudomonas]RZI30387.1 GAF domain-containing sensor histidine kinase [Pseudomonas orientalis]CRM99485.1 Bacteriophytochrome [Pseudomonas sp. 34 E 7]
MPTVNFAPDIRAVTQIQAVPMILRLVKHLTGLRFAAVVRVTEKHWVTCAVDDSLSFGLQPGDELELESTICHEIRQHRQPVVFGDASNHQVYATHHTPLKYGLRSYISVPIIRANGEFFGTLCAIDPEPSEIERPEILQNLTLFAQLIAANLDIQNSLDATRTELEDVRETGRLRDQFIAVLGHDLRTPLSAIRMSAELLETKLTERSTRKLVHAIHSSTQRMGVLIENVLDFARGRLGGGIPVSRSKVDNLQAEIHRVINEVRNSKPDAQIEQSIDVPTGIKCDPVRVGQLLSNLLGNAITHGDIAFPIQVRAYVDREHLIISVTNEGEPIEPARLPLIFQPYTRFEESGLGGGLGLGLYIASEIVKGHQGSITVTSTADEGTCFRACFPLI